MIRTERESDWNAVESLLHSAFATKAEANLVAALRKEASPLVSLVAVEEEVIVGHILFSPVTVPGHAELRLMGLAPMAVLPSRQRDGVGSALVRAGLDKCRKIGIGAVIVLGHPDYYPRFGFRPAVEFHISSEYDVPAEFFMLLELEEGFLESVSGQACYHPVFAKM